MKPFLAICFFGCLITTGKTQSVDFYGKQVAKDICNQFGFDDKGAKDCLDKICDAADIPNNFVLAPCTSIDNCFALYKNGYSYIVYDINFFNKVKTFGFTEKSLPKNNIDWVALTVLAHEIGHHMCLHTTNPNLSSIYTPVQIELQADEYAGAVMYKLGATLAQAQQAMNSSNVPEDGSLTHPGRSARLDAVAKGWNKEYKKNAERNGTAADNAATANIAQGGKNGSAGDVTKQANVQVAVEPDMVLVKGGTFSMGSINGKADEKPVHTVTVGDFYIGKYEVTVAEFRKFIKATWYVTTAERQKKSEVWNGKSWENKDWVSWQYDGMGNLRNTSQDNEPVLHVSWYDCVRYCQWMSEQTGKKYRLPTEAEWEYAAHGGSQSNGYTYSGSNDINAIAWYGANGGGQVHLVGQKLPNELGLFDMTGNVWEWCSDRYDTAYYAASPAQNPPGALNGTGRVIRGGCWVSGTPVCRSTNRNHREPLDHYGDIGFRVVMSF